MLRRRKHNGCLLMNLALISLLLIPTFAFAMDESPLIHGDKDKPTLTIHKYAHEKDDITKPGTGLPGEPVTGTPLAQVEFTIKQTHAYDPETKEWTEVTRESKTYTTGSDGQIVIENIELGRYQFQETDGPDHVILNDEKYYVDIPMTNDNGTELNYDVHVYPKNVVIRGDLEFLKTDDTNNALAGVTFGLYEEDGKPILEDNGQPVRLTTGENGKISLIGLAQGKYYLQEIETIDGFALNQEKIEFEILPGSEGEVLISPIDGFVDAAGQIINYQTPEIKKDVEGQTEYTVDRDETFHYNITIDSPGDVDQYKILGVNDTLDDRLSYAGDWKVSGTTKENIKFSQKGQKLSWYVKDMTALIPGEPIIITFTAKIKPNAKLNPDELGIPNEATLDFHNNRGEVSDKNNSPTTPPVIVDPTDSGLKIVKVDAANNKLRLAGAEFKLTTDRGGKDIIHTDDTAITVNGKKHTGLLENLSTSEYGTFTIDGLPSGTYYLHETKAPTYQVEDKKKSYKKLTKPIKINLNTDKNEMKVITVENVKPDEPTEDIQGSPGDPQTPKTTPQIQVPKTGGLGTIIYTLIGLTIIGLAIYLYIRRRKQEQQTS